MEEERVIDDLVLVDSVTGTDVFPLSRSGSTRRSTALQLASYVIQLLTSGSPTALDTWLEIVDRLEDDEDALAGLVSDLATKAPLDSPQILGNPTVPTQTAGNNSTRVANTAFVKTEIDAAVAINTLTAKTTPVDADQLRIADSAASNIAKKLTFANLWSWISGKVLSLFNAGGSAPVYACRAWVNFAGATGAILASGNVANVVRSSTGNYTVTLTTPLPDANYSAVASHSAGTTNNGATVSPINSTSFTVITSGNGVLADPLVVAVAVFR